MKHFIVASAWLLSLSLILPFGTPARAATYSVPVPDRLVEFARFCSPNTESREENGRLYVKYDLPSELVGEPGIAIHLEGDVKDTGFAEVTSSFGTRGHCLVANGAARTCLIKYPGLKTDLAAAQRYLEGHYKSSEVGARSEVVRIFHDDPAGILNLSGE